MFDWLGTGWAGYEKPRTEWHCRYCKKRFMSDDEEVMEQNEQEYYHVCRYMQERTVLLVKRKHRDAMQHLVV